MLTTTFRLLRKHDACVERYKVLRKALKGRKQDEPITLIEILDANGLDDALWALCAVPEEQTAERDRLTRLYACWCVRQVWHLLTDERSRHAVEVAERYVAGNATDVEMDAAWAAADAAARYAECDAAWAAARYAECDAAWAAAWAAARYAVWAAARAAAWAAARAAALAAACDAARYAALAAAEDAQAIKFRAMFA